MQEPVQAGRPNADFPAPVRRAGGRRPAWLTALGLACFGVAGLATVAALRPLTPDPHTVQARFQSKLHALSPGWGNASWTECDPGRGIFSVQVRHHDSDRPSCLCSVDWTRNGASVSFRGTKTSEVYRLHYEHGQFVPSNPTAAGLPADESNRLQTLAGELVRALYYARR